VIKLLTVLPIILARYEFVATNKHKTGQPSKHMAFSRSGEQLLPKA
jgi:hypothetical protein